MKMYCGNCGAEFPNESAVICVKCGVKKGVGNQYCWSCGSQVNPNSAVCLKCGVSLERINATMEPNSAAKSKLVAGLLALFLGGLGIHNFYLGETAKGIVHLVLFIFGALLFGAGPVISSIWALIEAILIFIGKTNRDGHGNPLKD